MAIYKPLVPQTDIVVATTKVKTAVSSTLPATEARKGGGRSAIQYPSGYARGVGECSSSFFTLISSSQIVDIAYGIRSGCFADSQSMFYQTDRVWSGNAGGFTSKGKSAFSTSSMVYSSTADYLNDGRPFQLEGDKIDLLGVLNFKRGSYREQLAPGTLRLTARASGNVAGPSGPEALINHTYTETSSPSSSIVGSYATIKSADGTVVGGVYHDYGVAVFDILKTFFTSSELRRVNPAPRSATSPGRANFMRFLTGSVANDAASKAVVHSLAFFSGTLGNSVAQKKLKYFNSTGPRETNLLNFYSGSYSQSLNSLATDLCGISAQSQVNFQSAVYFCRANKDQFNYSANPTFTTGSGENLTYHTEDPTTYVTSIGLFNDRDNLLAIGKLSQPLRKDFASEMNLRVRLDF